MEKNNTFQDDRKVRSSEIRSGESMQVPVVTQRMPGDGERITPSAAGESPTRQELEQDVAMTNPSVESMESRG